MTRAVLIIFSNILLYYNCEGKHWDYNDQHAWCELSNSCCGKKQSPVHLRQNVKKVLVPPFEFTDYSILPTAVKMENNGHSVSLTFKGVKPTVSGGALLNTYILESLHFHWGEDNYQGSEHIVNNNQAPLELHLVHYNSKFNNVSHAVSSGESDALAVLGTLYSVTDKMFSNPTFEHITSRIQYVKFSGESTEVKPFNFRKLLPSSTRNFFRYLGSLTTPTCDEVVVWTVFREPTVVTPFQMRAFRSTYSTSVDKSFKRTIANNYRAIQPLNQRVVYQGVESALNY